MLSKPPLGAKGDFQHSSHSATRHNSGFDHWPQILGSQPEVDGIDDEAIIHITDAHDAHPFLLNVY